MKSPFKEAAFLAANGTVYTTGCFHDIDAIPADAEIVSEGFMGHNGQYYSRHDAAEVLSFDHDPQSEELDLKKAEKIGYTFARAARAWTGHNVTGLAKGEMDLFTDDTVTGLRGREHVIRAQAGHKAGRDAWDIAAVMAAHPANPQVAAEATSKYGDNEIKAALFAHGLDPDDESLVMAIEAQLAMERMKKGELNVAVIPRIVQPGQPSAKDCAAAVQKAFAKHLVYEVHLGGKHSSGAAVAYDESRDEFWLLKPGSGKMSPSGGVRDTDVSQTRREVAFSQAAHAMPGLEEFVPVTKLLLLDGMEVACIQVLPQDYVPMQKTKDAVKILETYVRSGDLYRWALLDMVLGNPDRHSGNIMLTDSGQAALIDHGSALAGPNFNPSMDPKSFIPAYLRIFKTLDWRTATPEQKLRAFPIPTQDEQELFKTWIQSADEDHGWQRAVAEIADAALPACQARWDAVFKSENPLETLMKLWAGVEAVNY